MRFLLEILSLADRYERRARLLPGLVVAFPAAVTAGLLVQQSVDWVTAAGSALGIVMFAAFILGQLARARGKRLEDGLWESWGGPPSTRWLRPSDDTCSVQQKSKWRASIKLLTGLTIPASIGPGRTADDIDRVINDSVRQLRYHLRNDPRAALLGIHNEEYGFARNLYALRWLWVAVALLSAAACGAVFAFGGRPYLALTVAGAIALAAIFLALELPGYVRRAADRYAESLFAVAVIVSADSPPAAPTVPGSTAK